MINLKNFESNLLKIDKKHYKGIDFYYIGCITIRKIDDCENIWSINPLYLLVNHASWYIEKKRKLILDFLWFCYWKQRVTKKYADGWNGIKNEIKAINHGEENHYGKDYMKIKLNSVDDLSLN